MELAKRGNRVVVTARRKDRLDALVADIEQVGGQALAVEADALVDVAAAPLVEDDRSRGGVVLALRDRTIHRDLQQQVSERERLSAFGRMAAGIAHEVKNPLGGIRGAAQMLADELETGELAILARLIMRESDRIDELIQRFGHQELDCREVDLYPLLDEAQDLLAAEFGESVSIERDYDPSLPSISADSTAIRRVILNLLRNACQAGASVVLIRTRVEYQNALLQSGQGSVIKLQVIDNGQGVPESLRSLLFLPLVTGRRDGTGLGLALSQQIASAHGGLLTFEPLEQGSCFSFWLPFGNGHDVTGKGDTA